MRIKLIFPTVEYKDKIIYYRDDFSQNGDSMDGTAGLKNAESFETWLESVHNNLSEETVQAGLVPATTLIAVNEKDDVVGMIDIRHRLNDYLHNFGGHIGYSVIKSQRRKGIATSMLTLSSSICKKLGLSKLLITCYKENIASAKTILKSGGILENEVFSDGKIMQRYWIIL